MLLLACLVYKYMRLYPIYKIPRPPYIVHLMTNFHDLPPPLSSFVQNSSTPLTLGVQLQTNPLPLSLQIITNQLKENIIQRWPLHGIRSFLQVGFCSHCQLINIVWYSIDFHPFSWSKPHPQCYFKKLKTSFSSFSYSEKMWWGQGWAEASLSAFLWLYILMCTVVQKHHKMIFICNYSQL